MAKKLTYERYYWFHGQVKANRYPNAKTLAGHCDISGKQAQRDIEFMRDRIEAPLEYNSARRGYEYTDHKYELPPVWFSEEELTALCISLRLAAAIPDRKLKDYLHRILKKFILFRSADSLPALGDIEEMVSVKNIEYYKVDETVFRQVVGALFQKRAVRIEYHTPHTGRLSERIVLPLHLVCYMGNWHLIAYCSLKRTLRDFVLSRIRHISPDSRRITAPASLPPIKEYIRENFGIMSSGAVKDVCEVCLKFEPEVAEWISEQVWHRRQQISACEDGGITLRFPVADFREVKREILRYGASVQVISPPELCNEVRKEVEKMKKIYS